MRLNGGLERTVDFLGNQGDLMLILEEIKCLFKISLEEDIWKPQGKEDILLFLWIKSTSNDFLVPRGIYDAFFKCSIQGLHIYKEMM